MVSSSEDATFKLLTVGNIHSLNNIQGVNTITFDQEISLFECRPAFQFKSVCFFACFALERNRIDDLVISIVLK